VPPTELVKVLDFGIAKLVRDEQRVDQLETQAGTVFGTPRYMSPEQAQGNPLDARSDLYSLGVILYQMLSGRCPFVDDDAVVVMARHIKDTPPTFAELSPELRIPPSIEAVVRRSIAKYPDERPPSAELFAAELDAALENAGVLASGVHATSWAAPTSTVRTVVAPAHRPIALGVALVAALGLFVGGFFLVRALVAGRDAGSAAASSPVASAPAVEVVPPQPTSEAEPAASPEPANSEAPSAEVSDASAPKPRRGFRPRSPARAQKPAEPPPAAPSEPAPKTTSSPYGRFE
jgi:serine/threonine-protein kinase